MKNIKKQIKDWFLIIIKIIICSLIAGWLLGTDPVDFLKIMLALYLIVIGILTVIIKLVDYLED